MNCRLLFFALLPGVLLVFTACRQRSTAPDTGAYGPAAPESTGTVAAARPDTSAEQPWTNGALSVIQTELSPATLYHSISTTLTFFAGMPETGLGTPTYVAMPTITGPKIFANGAAIDAKRLNESWLVAWFAGAEGWTNWDVPWLVTLQRRPTAIELGSNGLRFRFAGPAGYAALMPIYGYYKPAQLGTANEPVFQLREKKQRVLTWEWSKALPADPLSRARYWTSALKEFPIYCEDTFSVDRSRDSVVLRQSFRFLSWDDDWNTRHVKLAPISPVLAHAHDLKFPLEFSKKPFDMRIFTPYGPFFGVEGVDSYDVTMPVLKFVNETEAFQAPDTNSHPSAAAALVRLRETAAGNFRDPAQYARDSVDDFPWAIQGEEWYPRALPYLEESTRATMASSLRKYFREEVLVTNRFNLREFPKGSGQVYYILKGPEVGSGGGLGDAGKLGASMLQTIWAYAHFTGDWELIQERWPLIRKLFTTPAETQWVGFGRDAVPELGDEAAPCLAMARLAYKVGDMESYNYACLMFARELVHHWVKQRGGPYFRENQPWHSLEPMGTEVFLTNLRDDRMGWHIDGPDYPKQTDERQFDKRWVRFKNEGVARFYREHLKVGVRHELDLLQTRWPQERRWKNETYALPSLVQLRSLLLNEKPPDLARVATPDKFTGPPSGVIASCISVLRTSHATRFERLIPGGPPSQFMRGVEREVPGPNVVLVLNATNPTASVATWPRISWSEWKTPGGNAWNFGEVRASAEPPAKSTVAPVNWNTRVITYQDSR